MLMINLFSEYLSVVSRRINFSATTVKLQVRIHKLCFLELWKFVKDFLRPILKCGIICSFGCYTTSLTDRKSIS